MSILIGFLYALEVIVCFLMGGIILLQKPRDNGLGGVFGGGFGEAVFGAQVGNVLVRATIILGAIFLLNTLVLSRLTSAAKASVMQDATAPAAQRSAVPAAPAPAHAPAPAAPHAPAAPAK